jgi:CDP-diacylglycerol--glycerol-3-phosphate 3-phosphatidyltransferase
MSKPNSPYNLPNAITVLRIALVPVFVWLLLVYTDKADPQRWLATLFFVLSIATDGIDGAIARRKGLITNLGKLLDPIADKALLGGALVVLSMLGEVAWWITIVILVREVGITVYRLIVVKKVVIAASAGGKFKTILQGSILGVMISPLDYYLPWLAPIELAVLYITLVVTVYTGLQYLYAAFRGSQKAS